MARGRPGQFVMVWVPGVDEFPMSVSYSGEQIRDNVSDRRRRDEGVGREEARR